MMAMKHETELIPHGTDYTWSCTTCGRKARHQLPLYLTDKNAKEHERKYNAKMPKIKITRIGGYDPALGPKHPDNQDPTLGPHVVTIERKPPETSPPGTVLHRWVCSCGCPPGEWKRRESQAQIGGTKHVQHKERGR